MTLTKKLGMALILGMNLFGCGSQGATSAAAGAKIEDPATVCEALFAREAACTDTYIPMLVDLRIRLDRPAGIAEAGRTAKGREELIAVAKEEWKSDSLPAARAQSCADLAPKIPAAQLGLARGCLAENACDAFVACVSPLHEGMLSSRK